MDFAQRSTPTPVGSPAPNRATSSGNPKRSNKKMLGLMRWSSLILLVSVAILILAVVASIGLSKTNEEAKFVAADKYQAVFLNGGQVYFGKINALNDNYLTMSDIYYLRVNQAVQPNQSTSTSNDVSLVKLGCELHGPQDQMVINNTQVVFWENLKTDGQVAKAVADYQKKNPDGQDCSAAAATTPAASSTTPATTTKKP